MLIDSVRDLDPLLLSIALVDVQAVKFFVEDHLLLADFHAVQP